MLVNARVRIQVDSLHTYLRHFVLYGQPRPREARYARPWWWYECRVKTLSPPEIITRLRRHCEARWPHISMATTDSGNWSTATR
jgi:hypothetical protein